MTNMLHLNSNKTGLALGGTLAVIHLLWSALVASGWAQFAMDWVFRLHFIQPPYTIAPFVPMYAVGLVVMTFVAGYVIGWIFSWILNTVYHS